MQNHSVVLLLDRLQRPDPLRARLRQHDSRPDVVPIASEGISVEGVLHDLVHPALVEDRHALCLGNLETT